MTLDEVYTVLSSTGLPVVYRAWPKPDEVPDATYEVPALPYICYMQDGDNNFAADGIAYYSALRLTAELYTADKDPVSETAVETALSAAGIFYEKEETYIDSEQCYQISYEFEV